MKVDRRGRKRSSMKGMSKIGRTNTIITTIISCTYSMVFSMSFWSNSKWWWKSIELGDCQAQHWWSVVGGRPVNVEWCRNVYWSLCQLGKVSLHISWIAMCVVFCVFELSCRFAKIYVLCPNATIDDWFTEKPEHAMYPRVGDMVVQSCSGQTCYALGDKGVVPHVC